MAPPKSTGGGVKGKYVAAVATSTRQTRSMARQTRSQTKGRGGGNSTSSKLMNFESPEKRKRKTKAKEGGAATKKIKKEKEEAVVEDHVDEEEEEEEEEEEVSEKKTIVIEHYKQHKSFKERANKVKEGLENAVPGIIVTLNPLKPRRGCFEIREEGGESFITLLDMKKPFTPMTELDMEEVVSNIVERIK
ncbi:hypothetical protein IGI04_038189 [Brassica rapa subsp. trilocularis]|uniref:Uncharacterized protein n=3 Tax=Brassica TaxID=3705 RepID=A0ABQ8C6M7_BRANA|nr:selenoprotein H-like [Brassica napus]XP_048597422.1 selenoprotein H-like [Brassica napus]KAG5386719.1 hypothetical protein IGI04_038189 [Brassica rapa subsp. trilocularis]KAH0912736.1 hypothetical protein HID58_036057 [Brassica napus]